MKKVVHFFLVIVVATLIHFLPMIRYGIGQASGQLSIIWQAEPIEEYMQKEDVPDSVKSSLKFIQKVRRFAIDSLGLNNSDNYTTIFDQKGEPILWVVTGAKPFKLEAKEWHFPILGDVPYKGFFNREKAINEYKLIEQEGLDAGFRTVGGWSTLGWFKDPILSNMLDRSKGDLANLIIHELVHATVFVKDSVEFNENLASFIADEGAKAFLASEFGEDSPELKEYLDELHDEKLYVDHILKGVSKLEDLYEKTEKYSYDIKLKAKRDLISLIMATIDTLSFKNKNYPSNLKGQNPNNSYFMSFMRYRSKQGELEKIYKNQYQGRIAPFVDFFKEKYPYL